MKRSHRRKAMLVRFIHPTCVIRPLVVLLFLIGGFGLVWVRTQVRDVRYRLTELEWELKAVEEKKQELRTTKAMLSSPARIESAARRVGFTLADRTRIFIVDGAPRTLQVSDAPGRPVPGMPRS